MNGWWATLSEPERAYVLATVPPDQVFMHRNVSQSLLSIARHYGGTRIDGVHFVYLPTHDELVRADLIAAIARVRRVEAAALRKAQRAADKEEAARQALLLL